MTARSDFAAARDERWFEDYSTGTTSSCGPLEVTQDDILDFAEKFDPQPIHLDSESAQNGPFGGLIASGWHTASLMMRLYADHYLSHPASLGGPGIDALRWVAPVRPGDELTLHTTVAASRRSKKQPEKGIVHTNVELTNQRDEVVFTCTVINMIRTRPQRQEHIEAASRRRR
ncbi:MaoC family dehydratase [Microbacterium gorillae]|uniref:MaoC family dehydratase n=1 Tax=Microbacterium gorillae TaxID=1231063 RepID=UPI0006948BDE|nr:MaoC family dehydratase [Microbacterium gorillae]